MNNMNYLTKCILITFNTILKDTCNYLLFYCFIKIIFYIFLARKERLHRNKTLYTRLNIKKYISPLLVNNEKVFIHSFFPDLDSESYTARVITFLGI